MILVSAADGRTTLLLMVHQGNVRRCRAAVMLNAVGNAMLRWDLFVVGVARCLSATKSSNSVSQILFWVGNVL